jgi:hypothetical protein
VDKRSWRNKKGGLTNEEVPEDGVFVVVVESDLVDRPADHSVRSSVGF